MAKRDQWSIWYIDANNLYCFAMMQKLPYKDLKYSNTSLDDISNTPDDSYNGYYIFCDFKYSDVCKVKTEQLSLMSNERKIKDNETIEKMQKVEQEQKSYS